MTGLIKSFEIQLRCKNLKLLRATLLGIVIIICYNFLDYYFSSAATVFWMIKIHAFDWILNMTILILIMLKSLSNTSLLLYSVCCEYRSMAIMLNCSYHCKSKFMSRFPLTKCSQVDPIVASFSGGAVGVISALMVVEVNNVKQQEHKRCKYCLGTGMVLAFVLVWKLSYS